MEKILTDNTVEKITVKWDGERFALIHKLKDDYIDLAPFTTILNPKEMLNLVEFANKAVK